MYTKLLLTCFLLSSALALSAQNCPFDPTVEGNQLVCPNDSLTLTTQQYDAYQWYTRPYGSGTTLQPVAGATGPTFTVQSYDLPMYVALEATLNGCTERSPEVLVDGWAFLPIFVISEGDFETGPNGEMIICEGDTAFLTLGLPYTTSITWYESGEPIPGQNAPTLFVTHPGVYTASAAPAQCPNFVQYLGVELEVVLGTAPNCAPSPVENTVPVLPVQFVPNPAHSEFRVTVDDPGPVELVLLDALGKMVVNHTFVQSARIDVADLPRGTYFAWLSSAKGTYVRKVVVSED